MKRKYIKKNISIEIVARAYELKNITDMSYIEIARALCVNCDKLIQRIEHVEKYGMSEYEPSGIGLLIFNYLKDNNQVLTVKDVCDVFNLIPENAKFYIYRFVKEGLIKRTNDKIKGNSYGYYYE